MESGLGNNKGFTLIEIMVGLLILAVAFVSLSSVFTSIGKSILVNRNKTIATNLVQEKIEVLKNISYYRLLVTTSPATDSNFPGVVYDGGSGVIYYPEETLNVGGVSFKRRTFVEFLEQNGNELRGYPYTTWTSNDMGIKRITAYVVWSEGGEWRSVQLSNLRNDPDRVQIDFTFSGRVTARATGNPMEGVLVESLLNPASFDTTDSNGNYSFKVTPGSHTLRATATGYFVEVSTSYGVLSGLTSAATHNFQLSLRGYGSATGYAFIQDHLVITQVVAYHDSGGQIGQEWVELYNPTTYNILIASRSASSSSYNVFFVTVSWIDNSNNEPGTGGSRYLLGNPDDSGSKFTGFRTSSTLWDTRFSSRSTVYVATHSYFLISNFSTVAANGFTRIADAYYDGGDGDDYIDQAGGIRVTGKMGRAYNGNADWHDGLGWGNAPVAKAIETTVNTNSLSNEGIFHRVAYASRTTDCFDTETQSLRTSPPFAANSFDRNVNGGTCGTGADFDYNSAVSFYVTNASGIANADVSMKPYSGTPAAGAAVTVSDGFSSLSYVQEYGSYSVTGIATGTWIVTITSDNYTQDISSVAILPSVSTGIPNNSTAPTWTFSSRNAVELTTAALYCYVSGVVTQANGNGLSGVTLSASGATDVVSDANGRYRLNVAPAGAPITVTASKASYASEAVSDLGVEVGMNISTVNFTLIQSGSIKGFAGTNNTPSGALPGILFLAYDSSTDTVKGSALSGADGRFIISDVSTGVYVVLPQLESGESSSPASKRLNVVVNSTGSWASTFTITNAYGELYGIVGAGVSSTSAFTTGVLVVASTVPINTEAPPSITSTIRSGTSVYYSASSDSSGNYSLTLRGNTSYHLYGWYPMTLDVTASSAPKRKASGTVYVGPGASVQRNITW